MLPTLMPPFATAAAVAGSRPQGPWPAPGRPAWRAQMVSPGFTRGAGIRSLRICIARSAA